MTPEAIIDEVKKSGLRGRGGAGFPTGMKWGFVPKDNPKPKYLLINADESEPGTFKDHVLLERNPHLLFEGCVIGCRAIGAKVCYIYIRGEFYHLQRQLEAETRQGPRRPATSGRTSSAAARTARSACTAAPGPTRPAKRPRSSSRSKGKRAQPRIKPPFPAVVGLYGCPTVVNNVETICNVPPIIERGADVVRRHRPGEEHRPEAVLRQRPRQAPRRLRGARWA